ncbi:MBL fold metallo-hydrolase [Microbulbifer sp. GL-2]|uniref:MBL fold metallo-hydrolase n=1 Tax=Microbulbifer sp. GL-2 TaxID=2591606 RepID=UPI001164BA12|nr:MBL fold metallo-hydrolase [Microbulbifer sp. GL-2]BBM01143.1 cyclase [Microbulbifer sp. GL-2]
MKGFRILISILFLFISSTALSSGVSIQKISEQLHILSGKEYETNIGLIATEDGLVLIDPMPGNNQLSGLNEAIQSIHNEPISFILNTHAHSDHTGGNEYFKKQGGKLIENTFNLDGFTHIKVKSHSEIDNIYYHKESNSIFVGDVFDTSWHPTFYSGGIKGFNEAIDAILNLGDDQSLIIPGHGVPSSKSSLLEFRKNTFEWTNKIQELHQKGMSMEEIMIDTQVKDIVEKFNVNNKSPFLPKKAYRRFIERTISVINNEKSL